MTLTVAGGNDSPAAGADTASTAEAVPVVIDVLANDSDADGDPLTVTAVGQPLLSATPGKRGKRLAVLIVDPAKASAS